MEYRVKKKIVLMTISAITRKQGLITGGASISILNLSTNGVELKEEKNLQLFVVKFC